MSETTFILALGILCLSMIVHGRGTLEVKWIGFSFRSESEPKK
jgi:hypothetical protein